MLARLLIIISVCTQLKSAEQPPIIYQMPPQYFMFHHTTSADNQIMFNNQMNVQQESHLTNSATNIQKIASQARDKRKNMRMVYFHG